MQVTDQDVQGAEDRVAALRQQINDRELADATARRESENEQKLAALEAEEARLQTQLDAMAPADAAAPSTAPAPDAPVVPAAGVSAGSSSTPPSSDAPPVPPTPAGSSSSASPAGTTDNGGK